MYEDIPGRMSAAERTRSPLRAIIATTVVAFVAGGALVWTLAETGKLGEWGPRAAQQPAAVVAAPKLTAENGPTDLAVEAHQAAQQVAEVAQVQGGLDQRVAAMEQRIARLDLQAQAAAGNASRAEGLLVAFAARRALERGAGLGYIEDQLKLRFADAKPNAVRTVIDAAKDPVTLDQLASRLSALSPAMAREPASDGALTWISRKFSRLFVVRREDSPSPAAANRIERARLFLDTARADLAAAEIAHLPSAAQPAVQDWIADARRYAAAQQALDLVEMTAIEEPRELRDAAGKRVQQPSPVG